MMSHLSLRRSLHSEKEILSEDGQREREHEEAGWEERRRRMIENSAHWHRTREREEATKEERRRAEEIHRKMGDVWEE